MAIRGISRKFWADFGRFRAHFWHFSRGFLPETAGCLFKGLIVSTQPLIIVIANFRRRCGNLVFCLLDKQRDRHIAALLAMKDTI